MCTDACRFVSSSAFASGVQPSGYLVPENGFLHIYPAKGFSEHFKTAGLCFYSFGDRFFKHISVLFCPPLLLGSSRTSGPGPHFPETVRQQP